MQRVHFPGLDHLISDIPVMQKNASLLDGMIRFDSGKRKYPPGLLPETVDALDGLTEEEITQLTVWRDKWTNEFICVGFVGPDNKITKWADNRRALAIAQLEKQIKWEEQHVRRV